MIDVLDGVRSTALHTRAVPQVISAQCSVVGGPWLVVKAEHGCSWYLDLGDLVEGREEGRRGSSEIRPIVTDSNAQVVGATKVLTLHDPEDALVCLGRPSRCALALVHRSSGA